MSVAREGHAAAVGPDGRIYAIAGPTIDSVEAYTADVISDSNSAPRR